MSRAQNRVCAASTRRSRAAGALPAVQRVSAPAPPRWVHDVLRPPVEVRELALGKGLPARVATAAGATLVQVRLTDAAALPDEALAAGTARLYTALGRALARRREQPLRIWNYVPGIGRPASDGFRRYEVFNYGRFLGLRRWIRAPAGLPPATAVGHDGGDLKVDLLSADVSFVAVESPRQRPAWRYSARYGWHPPCFARAAHLSVPLGGTTRSGIQGLVSGTASIVGEESRHRENLAAQILETERNLAAIASAVAERLEEPDAQALARFRDLRVYGIDEAALHAALEKLRVIAAPDAHLEAMRADLCRPELLVEIEGTLRECA